MPTTTDRRASTPALTARLSAACRDPRHHCALVLAANAGLVACGAAEPFTAALALHLVLLPFNAWRLLNALRTDSSEPRPARHPRAATVRPAVVATHQRAASKQCPEFDAMATVQTVRLSNRAQPGEKAVASPRIARAWMSGIAPTPRLGGGWERASTRGPPGSHCRT